VRRLALASVVANSAIVVTGGAVRLTASGLGCPTWPSCTDSSYTPTAEYAVHGVIEFGNRLLTFVLLAVVLAGTIAVWRLARSAPACGCCLRWSCSASRPRPSSAGSPS
jgi:cytochrome c oxidase assembly protein subunit 15